MQQKEVEDAVDEMKKQGPFHQGLVKWSNSPWSSAVVLVRKDGSHRFYIDYLAVNIITIKDAYPIPRVDDTLDTLVEAQWFSTLDLESMYHQVEMAERERQHFHLVRDFGNLQSCHLACVMLQPHLNAW